MARAGKLDGKAKWALAGLVLVVLFILAMVLRNAIVAVSPDAAVPSTASEDRDDIIQIGSHVLLLKHGSSGNRIANWLHAGSKKARAFEVGEQAFEPNSAALTSKGESEASTFADMMSHVPSLNARILVSTEFGNSNLSGLRAQTLRSDLIHKGVPASHVTVSPEPLKGGEALSKQPELLVVLST